MIAIVDTIIVPPDRHTIDTLNELTRRSVLDAYHPDEQLGIDRWSVRRAGERCQIRPQIGKIDKSIDGPQQVIRRNVTLERELVEQSALINRIRQKRTSESKIGHPLYARSELSDFRSDPCLLCFSQQSKHAISNWSLQHPDF